MKLEGKQGLYLRVLARPFSNVYADKKGVQTVIENLPAFKPFYVYTRPNLQSSVQDGGWYEIGTDYRGTIVGWMKGDDLFEWKQTLCLAYTHPDGRNPVLMFENKDTILDIIELPRDKRIAKVSNFYESINSKKIPPVFPIVSVEPKKAVDISEQFYLLPVIDFEVFEMEGFESRLLKLSAVTNAVLGARGKTDIRSNNHYLDNAIEDSIAIDEDLLKNLTVDIVWVMDTTTSMRHTLQETFSVIKNVSQDITKDQELNRSIRFGFWGFRDTVQAIPNIEYVTMNYTPQLQTVDAFINTLSSIHVTMVDSKDYAEDLFSGVNDAIRLTKWTPNALRIIILIGDAPGHEAGHKWNLSLQTEKTLRELADDNKIYIFAIHLKDPRYKHFYSLTQKHFKTLSKNKGLSGKSTYFDVDFNDIAGFNLAATELTRTIGKFLQSAKAGKLHADYLNDVVKSQKQSASASRPVSETAHQLMTQMVRAALVEWVGTQTKATAPKDIVAWASDKDLIEPVIQSLEVRLLINKRQLDTMATTMKKILTAGTRGQNTGEEFFSALQAVSASSSRDPNLIAKAMILAETGLVPEFLEGLPYKSLLMNLTNEIWATWSIDEQDEFLSEVEAKMTTYRTIHDSPDGWIPLNPDDDPDEFVYPISLDLLP